MHRRFHLHRSVDHTGVSGIGIVAEGVEFSDGVCVIRWFGEHRSTVVWGGIEDVLAVHGHLGSTEVKWLDPVAFDTQTDTPRDR